MRLFLRYVLSNRFGRANIQSRLYLYALAQLIGLAHQLSAHFHTPGLVALAAAEDAAQLNTLKAVYPALDAVHGTSCGALVLGAGTHEVDVAVGIRYRKQRIRAVKHGLELAGDAVIIYRRREAKHVGVLHLLRNEIGVVALDAMSILHALAGVAA